MSLSESQSIGLEEDAARRGWRVIAVAVSVFVLLWLYAAVSSEGFIEADARTHYLSARFALSQPHRFISVWDRPLFMLLYSVPAATLGVMGTRTVSLIMALLCAWTAWRIAARLGMRRPEWAFVTTLASPLLYLHSFSEMTELCFAALTGLALLAYLDRKWVLMAVLVAISPLGRPEGFGLILLAAAALALNRRWWHMVILPLGLLAWTTIGWLMWGLPDYGHGVLNALLWLPKQWPYSGASAYDPGPLLLWKTQPDGGMAGSLLLRLPVLAGPLLFPFTVAGTVLMLRSRTGSVPREQCWGRVVTMGLPWAILAGHSVLWWRGIMASNGELRYLLVTAPMWGVVGAFGWEWASERLELRKAGWVLAGLALLPALANVYFRVVPLGIYDDDRLALDVAQWYRSDAELQRQYPRLTASYIAVYQYLDMSMTDRRKTVVWSKAMVKQRPAGVVLVWDDVYAMKNADTSMCVSQEELKENGWRELRTFERGKRVWDVYLSPEPAVEKP